MLNQWRTYSWKIRNKGDYTLDLHGTLYENIKDSGKDFRSLIVPETIQKIYAVWKSQ